jgi:hypothetical protein
VGVCDDGDNVGAAGAADRGDIWGVQAAMTNDSGILFLGIPFPRSTCVRGFSSSDPPVLAHSTGGLLSYAMKTGERRFTTRWWVHARYSTIQV